MKATILSKLLLCSMCLAFVFSGCETAEKAEGEAIKWEGKVIMRTIPAYNVSDSSWNRSGYHDAFGSFAHYYGGDYEAECDGFVAYNFEGAKDVMAVKVTARLSAEADNYVDPTEKSDVTVYINGVKMGTKEVMHDDFYGQVYTWTVDDPKLINKMAIKDTEENEVQLSVEKDAKNRHGICIYGKALEEAEQANAVLLTVKLVTGK